MRGKGGYRGLSRTEGRRPAKFSGRQTDFPVVRWRIGGVRSQHRWGSTSRPSPAPKKMVLREGGQPETVTRALRSCKEEKGKVRNRFTSPRSICAKKRRWGFTPATRGGEGVWVRLGKRPLATMRKRDSAPGRHRGKSGTLGRSKSRAASAYASARGEKKKHGLTTRKTCLTHWEQIRGRKCTVGLSLKKGGYRLTDLKGNAANEAPRLSGASMDVQHVRPASPIPASAQKAAFLTSKGGGGADHDEGRELLAQPVALEFGAKTHTYQGKGRVKHPAQGLYSL